jgi:hypothetical protein
LLLLLLRFLLLGLMYSLLTIHPSESNIHKHAYGKYK